MRRSLRRAERNTALRSEEPRNRFARWTARWLPPTPTVPDSRFQAVGEPYPDHWREFPPPWPPLDPADDDTRAALNAALDQLPDTWREVILARDGLGREPADVSRAIGADTRAGARDPEPRTSQHPGAPGTTAGPPRRRMSATAAIPVAPRSLGRRILPLQIAVGLQGTILWVPVEKLFMTQIGFTARTVGVMAAAYAAVVPLFEVPSGVLADRWSRNLILVCASVALLMSTLVGGLSASVPVYIAGAMILGIYFALNSGTVDSVVYDVVLEETGSS